MKHKLLIFLIILLSVIAIFLTKGVASAEAPITPPKAWNKQEVKNLIHDYAKQYKVSEHVMNTVISCESQYNKETLGDHGRSFGLVQIDMDFWSKEITPEMAKNPDFAVNFLAEKLSKGEGHLWTCYRKNFK